MYEEYKEVARALQLELTPPDPHAMTFSFTMSGKVDGQFVSLTRLNGKGSKTSVSSPISPMLDLGLSVSRPGVLGSIRNLFGSSDIRVGDPSFDETYGVRSDEPSRAVALLNAEVRALLMQIRLSNIELTDREFAAELDWGDESTQSIERALREVARASKAAEAAAALTPPASTLTSHHSALATFAAQHGGLFLGPSPLWMEGRLVRVFIAARSHRIDVNEHSIALNVGTEASSFDLGLSIQPRRSVVDKIAGALRSGSAITTGDATFDEHFETHTTATSDEAAVRAVLGDDFRRGMLELAGEATAISADDRGLRFQAKANAIAPSRITSILESMRSLVELRFTAAAHAYR